MNLSQKLRIAEIFKSIQGEGGRIGTPSLFIRVSGCNLRCGWCDTPYASWNPEGPTMSLEEILKQVDASQIQDIVLTGGEPMLFDAIEDLIVQLKLRNHFVTVETAGTVYREMSANLMSISPKLKNSVPTNEPIWATKHEKLRSNLEPLKKLIKRYDFQLKFVVIPENEGEIQEIKDILNSLGRIKPDQVYLMPEGRDPSVLLKRAKQLVPICLETGWRIAPRYQIDLFGDTRGT